MPFDRRYVSKRFFNAFVHESFERFSLVLKQVRWRKDLLDSAAVGFSLSLSHSPPLEINALPKGI
jgi:hypothetical protein